MTADSPDDRDDNPPIDPLVCDVPPIDRLSLGEFAGRYFPVNYAGLESLLLHQDSPEHVSLLKKEINRQQTLQLEDWCRQGKIRLFGLDAHAHFRQIPVHRFRHVDFESPCAIEYLDGAIFTDIRAELVEWPAMATQMPTPTPLQEPPTLDTAADVIGPRMVVRVEC
jgi:hypothetical protein